MESPEAQQLLDSVLEAIIGLADLVKTPVQPPPRLRSMAKRDLNNVIPLPPTRRRKPVAGTVAPF